MFIWLLRFFVIIARTCGLFSNWHWSYYEVLKPISVWRERLLFLRSQSRSQLGCLRTCWYFDLQLIDLCHFLVHFLICLWKLAPSRIRQVSLLFVKSLKSALTHLILILDELIFHFVLFKLQFMMAAQTRYAVDIVNSFL